MQTQYGVLGYRIDRYFFDCKLEIGVDELGNSDENEIQKQKAIEKELGCDFIKINPDDQNFNIFKVINKIHRCIKQSFKK